MGWLKRFMGDDSGFTVVEYLVAAAILFIVSTGVMGALAYASTANASTAMRELGLEVANQRMEQARNLPYDSLGTTNGYPLGTIVTPDTVTVTTPEGNKTFTVVTQVDWSVDSASNLSSDKTVRITVSWANPRPGSVSVESSVVGKSTLTNAGDVKINIVDSDTSAKVPGATITIKPSGGLTVSKTTGVDGFVRWGKVPAGSITITGTCSTHYLDMSPVSGAIVLTGQLNEWTIQAVRPSSGTVHVTDQLGNNLAGVAVTISGPAGSADWSCPTGTGTVTSDANGNAVFPKLRKGTYTVTGVLSNYAVEASPPTLNVIAGGSSYTSQLRMDRLTNIRVTVVDSSNNPISGATVSATGVTFAATTNGSGQATSNGMGAIGSNKTYTVTATKVGYLSNTGTVTLSQYTQGTLTIVLSTPPPTTIKVTVLDNSNNPISGATVSATGVTFASTTNASGQATSDDMGAIGTNVSYTVTAAKSGYSSNTGVVILSQYTQGTLTIKLSPPPPTTIKVTVTDNKGKPIPGATVSASGVTFASTTDANGQATSNDMGAIGTNKTYTVTAAKTGWVTKTGTVTLSQNTQGTVTIALRATLEVTYSTGTYPVTIYIYTSKTAGSSPAYQLTMASAADSPASFALPAATYYVSQRSTYSSLPSAPKTANVVAGSTLSVSISNQN
jgi:protocatechuate 3,4-dioxygenase beta subunit/Tfp pilus assembly protein PilV